jgi:hypothetical protein
MAPVSNMVALRAAKAVGSKCPAPFDYEALEACFENVASLAIKRGAAIHMPKIASRRAGQGEGEGEGEGRSPPRIRRSLSARGRCTCLMIGSRRAAVATHWCVRGVH